MTIQPPSLPSGTWDRVSDPGRRQVVASLVGSGLLKDADFDRLVRLAAKLFETSVALVTLVDADREWLRSKIGVAEELTDLPIAGSFCAFTISDPAQDRMVVLDARVDDRFRNSPLVMGEPFIRFYAGAPVTVHGERVGSICVMSSEPRQEVDPKLLDDLVELAGVVGTLFELKDEARVRARTAAELMKEEWRHALTLEAGKVGSWVWDLRAGTMVINDILRRMMGLTSSGTVPAQDVFSHVHPDDIAHVHEALNAAFEDGVDYVNEFRTLGGERWIMGRGRVYQRDARGKPLVMMGIHIDITEQRQVADNTRLLLRELNHRVKNTLAMIQSLARQTMRQSSDPEEFIEAFSGRLRTLSDAHVLLANRDWGGIHLKEVVAAQVGENRLDEHGQVRTEGEDIHLPPDHALGLGVILHELTSNAVKHGALSVPDGRVDLRWTLDRTSDPMLTVQWAEQGGPLVEGPQEYGLGARLIERSLAKVLGSSVELTFPPDGVRAKIVLPVS